MQRNELIERTAVSADYPYNQVEEIVDAFMDTIIDALQTQERIELRSDFGCFVVRSKGGENAAGYISKMQRVVSFKATPTLKKYLRQSDQDFADLLRAKAITL